MYELTTRRRNVISGLIALTLVFAVMSVGIKFAFGAFTKGYDLTGSFASAGQGLIPGSDVKIRGVNVGKVKRIELVDGRALVTMKIRKGQQVATTTEAVVRPKTLFGEKFIDLVPGEGEATGPFYAAGDRIQNTLGGFELEQVLSDAYPLLRDISPDDIFTVLDSLATGAEGMGPTVNRLLANSRTILDVQAAHDADTRQFLSDLAKLSGELGRRGDDLAAGARSLNVALPTLNENGDALSVLLSQTARLTNDVADLLENHEEFVDRAFHEGQATLDVLANNRNQIIPLVIGLRQYAQTLTEAAHVPAGDGTTMGGVHAILSQELCLLLPCPNGDAALAANLPNSGPPSANAGLSAIVGGVTSGTQAILDLILGFGAR